MTTYQLQAEHMIKKHGIPEALKVIPAGSRTTPPEISSKISPKFFGKKSQKKYKRRTAEERIRYKLEQSRKGEIKCT